MLQKIKIYLYIIDLNPNLHGLYNITASRDTVNPESSSPLSEKYWLSDEIRSVQEDPRFVAVICLGKKNQTTFVEGLLKDVKCGKTNANTVVLPLLMHVWRKSACLFELGSVETFKNGTTVRAHSSGPDVSSKPYYHISALSKDKWTKAHARCCKIPLVANAVEQRPAWKKEKERDMTSSLNRPEMRAELSSQH